eukprot:956802-Pelagomonas_calceolata.AAC.2
MLHVRAHAATAVREVGLQVHQTLPNSKIKKGATAQRLGANHTLTHTHTLTGSGDSSPGSAKALWQELQDRLASLEVLRNKQVSATKKQTQTVSMLRARVSPGEEAPPALRRAEAALKGEVMLWCTSALSRSDFACLPTSRHVHSITPHLMPIYPFYPLDRTVRAGTPFCDFIVMNASITLVTLVCTILKPEKIVEYLICHFKKGLGPCVKQSEWAETDMLGCRSRGLLYN